ncbi:DUF302 domain-containing protein [Thermoanaerobacterium butyriciformans]|uniref:Uncharacterized protein (DUF302 family) n=1 Tax=Thermoanaerobacterium butyriciformans TaxID=1702242 RepID=A0ABS4NHH4_9THEO|nr:DUF302 domain-containing protein [Thermoanaerobacterium butyriciformans]MBP2073122.1 uncharacterized protein (DUF302 family) [Thermoanaerobacterium butyriciformans]HHV75057.1 DUF302 domain-containing protein [Thermoanaerobacterium sp.]
MNFDITKEVPYSFDVAIEKVKETLKEVGFGVLVEIDIRETIKKKIGKDMMNYIILGACNPKYAYEVLNIDPMVGLLLPCNVIVYEQKGGNVTVSSINPEKAIDSNDDKLREVASEVADKLKKAIDML